MASERPVQEGDLQSQVQALMRRLNYKQVTIVKEVGITKSGHIKRFRNRLRELATRR